MILTDNGTKEFDDLLSEAKVKQLVVLIDDLVGGGSIGEWRGIRAWINRGATMLSRPLIPADLTDPMSGFFALRREAFNQLVRRTSGLGFKLLLDLFASSPYSINSKICRTNLEPGRPERTSR